MYKLEPVRIKKESDPNHIILKINSIRELLIAPDFNPFSDRETEFMGQSAMCRVIKQLEPGWTLESRKLRLTILLPEDQITPGLTEETNQAIQRYCEARTEDNKILLKNIRWNGFRQIPFSFAFLAACIAIGTLLGSGLIPLLPQWLGRVLNEGFIIIGWVALWGPTETLIFDPLPIKRENEILKEFMNVPVDIQPQI